MDLGYDDLTQKPIARMNSSTAAFKELIQNLRIKNRKADKKVFSEINPESDCSNSSQACFSEAFPNHRAENKRTLAYPLMANQGNEQKSNGLIDTALKLKPRRSVAGRDILYHQPSNTAPQRITFDKQQQKQEPLVVTQKQPQKEAWTIIPAVNFIRKDNAIEEVLTHPKITKSPTDNNVAMNLSKYLNNLSTVQHIKQPSAIPIEELENSDNKDSFMKNNGVPSNLLKSKSFNQNRLNSILAKNLKIKDIDQQLVIRYYNNANNLTKSSQAPDIFDFFENLLKTAKIIVQRPLIKKFKNCIYFGHQINQNQKYEGFLYFYDNKFYYGQFLDGQKNGNGVQIIIQPDQIVYKGNFTSGQKTGKFYVRVNSLMEEYIGHLEKGLYHGKGKLIQKQSVYEGDFVNGEKHGFGQEYHPRTGVKFSGYFNRGHFQKRSKSNFDRNELDKGINFKQYTGSSKGAPKFNMKMQRSNKSHVEFKQSSKALTRFDNEKNFEFERSEPLPFSSSTGFNYQKSNSNKPFYSKQKIRGYPPVKSNFNDPMPQNFQDFDYSFDISSRKDSDTSQFMPIIYDKGTNSVRRKGVRGYNSNMTGYGQTYGFPSVTQFPEITQQKLDTHESQQPLPMPYFLPRK